MRFHLQPLALAPTQLGLRDAAFSILQHLEEHTYNGPELINSYIYNTMLLVRGALD